MIATLIFILFLWAIYAFVLDGIIAPTIHDHLQNRVYATRDSIRKMRREQPEKVSDAVFQIAESTANSAVHLIPITTIGMLIRAKRRYAKDSELSSAVNQETKLLMNCEMPLAASILQLYYRVTQAAVVNSSNWSVVVVPIFMVIKSIKKLSKLQWFFDQSHVLLQLQYRAKKFRADNILPC